MPHVGFGLWKIPNEECAEEFLRWKKNEPKLWKEYVDEFGFDPEEKSPWKAWDDMKLAEERRWRAIESTHWR